MPAFLLLLFLAQKHQVIDDWKLEERETIRKVFSVTAGSNPKKLLVDNISGSIHVTGYAGHDVQVTVERHTRAESKEALADAKREIRLDVSQQGNYVRVYEDGPFRNPDGGTNFRGDRFYGYNVNFDYDVQVPYGTELALTTVNHGDISVRNTTASFEVRNVNGGIAMDQVAGSGTVNTVNGAVTVHFAKNPTAASSFKTLNGQVDIWFQPELSADLRFKTFNGDIYTDFDVAARAVPASAAESRDGKFIYKSDRNTLGRVGRGGPELSFDAFNGNIRLHSK